MTQRLAEKAIIQDALETSLPTINNRDNAVPCWNAGAV
jgi:hypothetical protein